MKKFWKNFRTTQNCHIVDAREEAPGLADENFYEGKENSSVEGWLSVAVPGDLHGLWTAYKNFGSGKISWTDLFQPSIDLCVNGFPVSQALAGHFQENFAQIQNERTLKIFINPKTNRVYETGEIIRMPELGGTLKFLANAENPVELFYKGKLAELLSEDIQKNGN